MLLEKDSGYCVQLLNIKVKMQQWLCKKKKLIHLSTLLYCVLDFFIQFYCKYIYLAFSGGSSLTAPENFELHDVHRPTTLI